MERLALGENKVQEASSKQPLLSDLPAEWHLIGSLQKNKANRAAEIFDWVESLDDFELAARLDRACERLNKRMPVLIQVNVGGEASKSGIAEEEAADFAGRISAFKHLEVRGLMAIPPYTEDPEESRPHFIRLREIAERIGSQRLAGISMKELSMGMSHDFPDCNCRRCNARSSGDGDLWIQALHVTYSSSHLRRRLRSREFLSHRSEYEVRMTK